jgi:formate/nitrite transporter FocA (FNT family)
MTTDPETSADSSAEPDPATILKQKPSEIEERATGVGEERLDRSPFDMFVTAVIGGVEVSLGGFAAMAVVGGAIASFPQLDLFAALALGGIAFPVGFLFVVIGRSELYTENFLIPVVAVFNRSQPARSLAKIWTISWAGNMAGCAGIALLLTAPGTIGHSVLHGYAVYTEHKLSVPIYGVFVSALLAGMIMTVLTWVLLALHEAMDRILAIWATGFLVFATNVSHTVVGASILFAGFAEAHRPFWQVLEWLAVATIGNLVGGVGLVTLFRVVQARSTGRLSELGRWPGGED